MQREPRALGHIPARGFRIRRIITRGGSYAGGSDTQTPYLKQFLGFIGLTDVEWVFAEGLAVDERTRKNGLKGANEAIARLQPVSAAAA